MVSHTNPSYEDLEKVSEYYDALYQLEYPFPLGILFPTYVTPFQIDDEIPIYL